MRNVLIVFVLVVVLALGWWIYDSSKKGGQTEGGEVVVYVAHDKDYAEVIFKEFTDETGIKVKARYDTETDKTVGHVNRLREEFKNNNPVCDLHWNNEPMHSVALASVGIYEAYRSPNAVDIPDNFKDPNGLWVGFAARARVFVYHTKTEGAKKIANLADYVNPVYKGKICLANPRAGSTQTHLAVLYATWGKEKFTEWIMGINANDVKVLDSNSKVADAVAHGVFWSGLTDTDDVVSRREGRNMACDLIFPDKDGEGTLVFPNTLAVIKGGPNPDNAKKLYDWLLTKELSLCMSLSAQIPLNSKVNAPDGRYSINMIHAMKVDWAKVSEVRDECVRLLEEKLVR